MFKKMLQFVCVVVLAVVMFMGTTANAAVFTNFSQCGIFNLVPVRGIAMAEGDSLKVQVGGITMTLAEAGLNTGYWYAGFTNSTGNVVGHAKGVSNPAFRGVLSGEYSGAPSSGGYKGLSVGEKPVGVYLVYDKDNDGWDITNGVVGSVADLLKGDLFFNQTQIIFGTDTTPGGVSWLSTYPAGVSTTIPSMTAVIVPEPATLAVLSLGTLLLRKRSNK